MAIVTAADLAARLGRTLTPDEAADVENGVAAAVAVIEARLHRRVQLDQWTEEKQPLMEGSAVPAVSNGWSGLGYGTARVYLSNRPVASIVQVVDTVTGADITTGCFKDGDTLLVPTLNRVRATYVAGDDPVAPIVKRVVIKAILRELFLPPAVASGAYSSYSVEGASFQANAPAPDETYPLNTSEMRSLTMALGRLEIR